MTADEKVERLRTALARLVYEWENQSPPTVYASSIRAARRALVAVDAGIDG